MGHVGAGKCTSSVGSVCSPGAIYDKCHDRCHNTSLPQPLGLLRKRPSHHLRRNSPACGANRQTLKGTGPASVLSACMNPQWFTSSPASELCPAHSYPPAACNLQPALSGRDYSHVQPAPRDDIIIIIINSNTSGSARLAGWLVGWLVGWW